MAQYSISQKWKKMKRWIYKVNNWSWRGNLFSTFLKINFFIRLHHNLVTSSMVFFPLNSPIYSFSFNSRTIYINCCYKHVWMSVCSPKYTTTNCSVCILLVCTFSGRSIGLYSTSHGQQESLGILFFVCLFVLVEHQHLHGRGKDCMK